MLNYRLSLIFEKLVAVSMRWENVSKTSLLIKISPFEVSLDHQLLPPNFPGTRSGFCNFMHLRPISRSLRRELYGRKRHRSRSSDRDKRRKSDRFCR